MRSTSTVAHVTSQRRVLSLIVAHRLRGSRVADVAVGFALVFFAAGKGIVSADTRAVFSVWFLPMEPLPVTFVVVGPVNAGKSTLCGHLLELTGAEEKRVSGDVAATTASGLADTKAASTDDRGEQSVGAAGSVDFARHVDMDEEERATGNTHGVACRDFAHRGRDYRLLDTPGHTSLTRHVVEALFDRSLWLGSAEAAGLVACVLVSAKDNDFEAAFERSPRLKELIALVRLAGVGGVVFVVTKTDRTPDPAAAEDGVRSRVRRFMAQHRISFPVEPRWVRVCPTVPGGLLDALLPAVTSVADAAAAVSAPCVAHKRGTPRLCDDEKDLRHWVQVRTLPASLLDASESTALRVYTSGTECVCHFGAHTVDVVLLDVRLAVEEKEKKKHERGRAVSSRPFARPGETFVCRIARKTTARPGAVDGKDRDAVAEIQRVRRAREEVLAGDPTRLLLRRGNATLGVASFCLATAAQAPMGQTSTAH